MGNSQILSLLKGKITGIVIFGFFVAALSFLAIVAKEKNFKVTTDYLIVQNQTQNEDFYTLSKSAEYTGRILNEGVYSEIFIEEIINTGKVNKEFLPFDKKERMKEWSKTVNVNRNSELGILSVEVFDDSQKQALEISGAIGDVLIAKNSLFLGEGQNISIKVLSGPITEKNPTLENVFATMIGGFVLGVMIGMLWTIYHENERRNKIFSHSPVNSDYAQRHLEETSPMASEEKNINRMEAGGNFMSDKEYLESFIMK